MSVADVQIVDDLLDLILAQSSVESGHGAQSLHNHIVHGLVGGGHAVRQRLLLEQAIQTWRLLQQSLGCVLMTLAAIILVERGALLLTGAKPLSAAEWSQQTTAKQ